MEDMGCNIRYNILYYNGKPWPHYRRVQEMAGTNKEVKVIIKGTGLHGGAEEASQGQRGRRGQVHASRAWTRTTGWR
jgi:hypothetical protein